jgi:hypothetical protein
MMKKGDVHNHLRTIPRANFMLLDELLQVIETAKIDAAEEQATLVCLRFSFFNR